MTDTGTVYLVGAGPGDPGLITIKGIQCLESAQVVVYDRLADNRLLGHAPPSAELIDVGKVPGKGAELQVEISALLVKKAREGKTVVRLKGGDPFVFGRGGEEAEALHEAGIIFEIVPGVSSAVAAPAYAGIPLTHRTYASSFTVVTGSEAPDKDVTSIVWDQLAQQGGTLVVLMGWSNLTAIVKALSDRGLSVDTPAALVRWGTHPNQETVVGTLANIVDRGLEAGLSPPVVAVFGDVVRLRENLRWFDKRPLFGKRVLVTRTRTQAGGLSELLSRRGAQPVELPTIEIKPPEDFAALDDAIRSLAEYGWVVFTSVNAVDAVFDRAHQLGLDARALGASKVGAIGSATATRLGCHGIVADFVPDAFVSEAAVGAFKGRGFDGARVLLPSADIARRAIAGGLSEVGAAVDVVTAYRTVRPGDAEEQVERIFEEGIDIVTFTSSSTVRNLLELLRGLEKPLDGVTIACIGPITAATAGEMGLKIDIIAEVHTIPGLVGALDHYFARENSAQ